MAKMRSGILGNLRGKVGGVVAGQWKDVNYLREYVKPANPNSAAQQTQRSKMTDTVAFAKTLVGPIFNVFTDKFIKSMSGFNFFVKSNIAEFDGTPDYSLIKITEGKLSPLASLTCTYDTSNGETVLAWDENIGNNGHTDDPCSWLIYDESTGRWYFMDVPIDRDAEADTQTFPSGLTATNLHCYILTSVVTNSIVTIISNSIYAAVSAP